MTINCGLIGFGYWGPNLARNINNTNGLRLVSISDQSDDRLNTARVSYSNIIFESNPLKLINNSNIDLVVIATPVKTHFQLGKAALEAGKHVLIEKPTTATLRETIELCEIASRKKLILATDFTFLFTPGIREVKRLLLNGDLGRVYHYDSSRINLGLVRTDTDVFGDLVCHDLSIISFLFGLSKSSNGFSCRSFAPDGFRSAAIAQVSLKALDDTFCTISTSWFSPVKSRKIIIAGTKKMCVFDDTSPDEALKIFDHGISVLAPESGEVSDEVRISYRKGNILVPKLSHHEALAQQFVELRDSIGSEQQPIHGIDRTLEVMNALSFTQQQK